MLQKGAVSYTHLQKALFNGVLDGTIDFIATDHAPVSYTHLEKYERN